MVAPLSTRVRAKSLQSCQTLCDPVDCSPPGSSVHGILQAEYCSGLPSPPPRDLPHPGMKPESLLSTCTGGGALYHWHPGKPSWRPSVQSSGSVSSQLCATPWPAARQASLSITNFQSLLQLMSIESVMPSNHLTLCCPFSSCLQSFPASGSFQMSHLFASGG